MKTIKEMISVMQAYEEGKSIEAIRFGDRANKWFVCEPDWNWFDYDYRVKEEPKYRPYENTEEMIEDFCERSGAKRSKMGEPFIWVKSYINGNKHMITAFNDEGVNCCTEYLKLGDLFRKCSYLDGSPCGKEIK